MEIVGRADIARRTSYSARDGTHLWRKRVTLTFRQIFDSRGHRNSSAVTVPFLSAINARLIVAAFSPTPAVVFLFFVGRSADLPLLSASPSHSPSPPSFSFLLLLSRARLHVALSPDLQISRGDRLLGIRGERASPPPPLSPAGLQREKEKGPNPSPGRFADRDSARRPLPRRDDGCSRSDLRNVPGISSPRDVLPSYLLVGLASSSSSSATQGVPTLFL